MRSGSVGGEGTELTAYSPQFKIRTKLLQVTSPSSGEVWYVGDTTKKIRWEAESGKKNDGSWPKVKIEYNVNDGAFKQLIPGQDVIVDCVNGLNEYIWTAGVADEKSDKIKIRISFVDYSDISITSDYFTIYPVINILSPNADSTIKVGSSNNPVSFTYTGSKITLVNVRYDTNNGLGADGQPATGDEFAGVIQDNLAVSGGSAEVMWNSIPDAIYPTAQIKVKVYDTQNPSIQAESQAFRIVGNLVLTAPSGQSTSWTAGSTQNISWNFGGTMRVNVFYNLNSGIGNWTPIAPLSYKDVSGVSGSATLAWDLPLIATNKARIKLEAEGDPGVYSISQEDFKIGAKFEVLNPEDGVALYVGDNYEITWNTFGISGVNYVAIEYTNNDSTGQTWNSITTSAPNSGSWSWIVPGSLADLSNDCRIRIYQYDPANEIDNTVNLGSGLAFRIKPKLIFINPSPPLSWSIGEQHPIKFKKRGAIQKVDLYYSYDGNPLNFTYKINSTPIDISGLADDTEYTYDWTIAEDTPLTPGYTGKIKVKVNEPATQTSVEAVQSNTIEVKGLLTLNTPSAEGISMVYTGPNYMITWTPVGQIQDVKLYYSTNGGYQGGGSYPESNFITQVASSLGQYSWPVPDKIGDNLRIKVCDANNCEAVYDESDYPFTIKGKLTLDVPDTQGIIWEVNTTQQIKWTPTGTWSSVEIHYDTDGDFSDGQNTFPFKSTGALTPNDGIEDWIVPDKISSNVKIRIRDPDHPDVQAISSYPFSIVGKINSVTSPSSGEVWYVGDTTKKIRWEAESGKKNDGSWPKVKIEYNVNDGAFKQLIPGQDVIVDCVNGLNEYIWTAGVADEKSDKIKIRISFVDYSDISITSDYFTIYPVINILSPNADSTIKVGSSNNPVSFTYTGSKITLVNVRYDTNNGLGADGQPATGDEFAGVIQDNLAVSGGSAEVMWNSIPDAIYPTAQIKVKVYDTQNPSIQAESQAFRIVGNLVLTAPSGQSTSWTAGSTQNISWNFGGTMRVNVFYNLNSGIGNWTPIAPLSYKDVSGVSGSATLAWDLPLIATNKARIKLEAEGDPGVYSISQEDFKIGAKFEVLNPEDGVALYVGDNYEITWNTFGISGVNYVAIEYTNNDSTGQTWNSITTSAPNSGSWSWIVPGSLADLSNDCRIRIYQYDPANEIDNTVNLGSGLAFRIKPKLIFINPSPPLSWSIGEQHPIKFKKRGAIQKVDLYYSYDGNPLNFTYKINSTPIDISGLADDTEYTYDWTIAEDTPLTPGYTGKIKVKVNEPATQTSVEAVQSNTIEVKGLLTLNTPSAEGISMVYTGPNYMITWTPVGQIQDVKLYYSTNGGYQGGGSYPESNFITQVASSLGQYSWPVPDKIGDNLRIKVCDANNCEAVYDESDYPFTIKGKLTLDVPDTQGIIWEVNTTQQIKWTPTGTWSSVEIHYDTDGDFSDGQNTFPFKSTGALTPNDGIEDWIVPDKISSNVKIRIRDPDHPDVQAISSYPFSIVGKINSVTSPSSGEVWYVGDENKEIRWDATGTVTHVDIAYKTSLGGAYNTIVAGDPGHSAGANSYSWPVVGDIKSETVYIRVCPAGTEERCAESAEFKIRPKITVTINDADGRLPVGSYIDTPLIKWTCSSQSQTPSVNVLYDLYNGNGPDGLPNTNDEYQGVIANLVPVGAGSTGIPWYNDGQGVPDEMTSQPTLKIKVVDSSSPSVFGLSNVPLKIVGDLTLLKPTTGGAENGEYLKVGQDFLIQWAKKGTALTQVTLWYSDDGGQDGFVHPILPLGTEYIPAGSTGGQYTWVNIPNTTSNNVIVRISDYNDPETKAFSPAIHIQSILDIRTPDGGETWAAGDDREIIWTVSGKTRYVKLQYAINGGGANDTWYDIAEHDNQNTWTAPPDPPAEFSYLWMNIPEQAVSNNVKIRVIDKADEENWNESASVFRIRPSVTVISPNGNEEWLVGSTQYIKWSLKGTVNVVDVLYSVDGGNYNYILYQGQPADNIPASLGGGEGLAWEIPNEVSSQVRIKIIGDNDVTIVDTSDTNFKIVGQINFSPAVPAPGDEVWYVGTNKTVGFTKLGQIPTLKLQYCTNDICTGEGDWTTIPGAENITELSHQFVIPDALGQGVRIRAASADPNRPAIPAVSGSIEIADIITIISPSGDERWPVGTTQAIEWKTNGSLANVKIEYSLDGTTQPIEWVSPPITNSTPSNSQGQIITFNWPISAGATTTSKAVIRISDANPNTGTQSAISNLFRIVGSFIFTSPTSSSVWPVTQGYINNPPQTISWTTNGVIPLVNLWYYSTSGPQPGTFVKINDQPINVQGTSGSYLWNVPDAISNAVRLRIEDATDPYIDEEHPGTSQVSSTFTICGALQLISPLAGTVLKVAPSPLTPNTISWNYNGSLGNLNIFYSLDGCNGPWSQINASPVPSVDRSYYWQTPENIMTPNACIKVENTESGSLYVKSDSGGGFNIVARIEIDEPDAGDTILAGEDYEIRWNKWGSGCQYVKIELSTDGINYDKIITESTGADVGAFLWLKDALVNASDNITKTARIRISDTNAELPSSAESGLFTIQAQFSFNPIVLPLEVGSQYDIVWTKKGNIPYVLLQYSTDNFEDDKRNAVTNINGDTTTLVPNVGGQNDPPSRARYTWTVPDIIDPMDIKGIHLIGADQVKLRVSDPNNSNAVAVSNEFKIIPKFKVTSPDGNADPNLTERLKVGLPYEITWTCSSDQTNVPYVRILYSTTGGPPYDKLITSSTANDGSYAWITANGGVPNDISTQVRIRIEDATDRAYTAYDESDNNFKIISNFTLNTPNGNAVYEVGRPWTISWSNKGTVNNVELSYSINGEDFSDPIIIASSVANNPDPINGGGSYETVVPNGISYNVRVRVRSLTDDGYDISDNNFRIRGRIEDVVVNNNQPVPIHQDVPITWTTYGTVPYVDILYDLYDGKGCDGTEGTQDDYWNPGPDKVCGTSDDYLNVIALNLPNCIPQAPALSCNGSATWTYVPDEPTPLGRIKISDSRTNPDNTDVKGISPRFNIIGNFTIISPNGNEDLRVGTQHNITWRWGGTIPQVRLFYTKNPSPNPEDVPENDWIEIDPEVIKDYSNDGKGDGSGDAERSYLWTVPDDIAPKVRIKIQDYNDPTVRDYSDNFFKIRGAFTLISPNGHPEINLAERWVTNEKHNISWITYGTIPYVRLQYSNDDFISDIHEIIPEPPYTVANCLPQAPELTCTGSYQWTIPNAVLKDDKGMYLNYNAVKVRIIDPNDPPTQDDPGVADVSDNNFKIDHYKITWKLYDLTTGEPLTNLSYTEKITGTDIVNRTGGGLTTPVILPTTYGTWTTTWIASGYGEKGQNFVADSDQSFTLFLETTVIHIWRAYSEFAYQPPETEPPTPDILNISSWLERDGAVVSGAVVPDVYLYDGLSLIKRLTAIKNEDDPQPGKITIYYCQDIPLGAVEIWVGQREDGTERTVQDIVNEVAPWIVSQETINESAFTGFFKQTWTDTPLESGKVYNTITDIMNKSGAHFRTPGSFEITAAKSLQEMQATVNSVLNKPISEVSQELQEALNTQTQLINQMMTEQTNIITQKTNEMQETINTTMERFENTTRESLDLLASGAKQAVEAGQTLEYTALKYSWKATVSPDPALVNDMITLQCQGQPGKTPFLTIYSWDNKYIVRDVPLKESSTPGLYIYEFKADSRFTPGKAYTYTIIEYDTDGFVTGSGMVESMSITTVAGLASAAPEAERAAKNALEAIKAVEAVLASADTANVALTLRNLKDSIEALPAVLMREGPTARIVEAVNNISERLNVILGEEGLDLSTLLEEALSESPTLKEIRKKTDTISMIIDLLLQIVEGKLGGLDTPVVSTSLIAGSVRFRIVAVNPSTIKTHKVQIKNYLPLEVKPKDILDLGGLELEYDSAKGIYYLYKPDLELAPKEVRIFEVEVEDIWTIPESKINELKKHTTDILKLLEKTNYFAEAKAVSDSIYRSLDEIIKSQNDDSVSREQHIGIYRQNIEVVKQIEEDIAKLEKMLKPPSGVATPEVLEKAKLKINLPSKTTTWLIIIAIIIFLGLLAGVFFFIWQAQVRSSQEVIKQAKESSFPEKENK
ncbi:MAG: hypothetical protein NC912_00695 [Candidatus Omnitrophica bacterium]|nr:hypothetical protein [Candidatus Omnitrophota bacterium]